MDDKICEYVEKTPILSFLEMKFRVHSSRGRKLATKCSVILNKKSPNYRKYKNKLLAKFPGITILSEDKSHKFLIKLA